MQKSYDRVFGTLVLNGLPTKVLSVLARIKAHTLNVGRANQMLDLSWQDYVEVKSILNIDLREVLVKKGDIDEFYADNAGRYIRLSYKKYRTFLYFEEQVKTLKGPAKTTRNNHKSKPAPHPILSEILGTTADISCMNKSAMEGCIFVDTETTGLFDTDHVIELGAVGIYEDILFDSLLRPKRKRSIHPKAMEAHGISEKSLIGKPRLIDVQREVQGLFKNKYVVFYNARFDVAKMIRSSDGNIFDGAAGLVCLMRLYKDVSGSRRNTSLIDACDTHGIDYSDLPNHRAVGDAIKTARLARVIFSNILQQRS